MHASGAAAADPMLCASQFDGRAQAGVSPTCARRRGALSHMVICCMEMRWLRGGSHGTVSPKLSSPFVLDYGGSLRLSPAIPTHCLAGPSTRFDDALFHPADAFSVGLQRAQQVRQAGLLHRYPAAVFIARRVDEFLASGREPACACVECSGQRRLGHLACATDFSAGTCPERDLPHLAGASRPGHPGSMQRDTSDDWPRCSCSRSPDAAEQRAPRSRPRLAR